jgi:hypothetical protein
MRPRISRRAVALVALAAAGGLSAVAAPASLADQPSPGMTVSPSSVYTNHPTNLVFTIDTHTLSAAGSAAVTVPTGWTAPQTTNPNANGYASATGAHCTPSGVTASGQTVTLTGGCVQGSSVVLTIANEVAPANGTGQFALAMNGGASRNHPAVSGVTVSSGPAPPASMVFSQQPSSTGVVIEPGPVDVWTPFSPPVSVTLYDAYGNLATGFADHVAVDTTGDSWWHGTTSTTVDPTTATATFSDLADGGGSCEIGNTTKTMTVNDTDRTGVSATSQGYCSTNRDEQGQLAGGG